MKIIKKKIAGRKINWLALSLLALMFIVIFTGNVAHASIFNWFDDTESQTEFLNNPVYQPYLKKYNGNFYSQFGLWIGWSVIKSMFAIVDGIQNMIPEVLDLFSFVESTGLNKVYQSVLSTIVIGLMVLSLVIIGYKMVTGKGTLDLKSVGMNVVMSVALILLMPTMSTNNTFFIQEMISIGVDHITFHYETSRHLDYDIKFVKQNNTKVGVALNPATPLSVLNYVLPEIDMVCLMLINPGFASQKSEKQISYGVKKISDLSKLILAEQLHTQIQVDGRVSLEVIPDLICAGANNLVLGSTSIFREGYSIKENRECLEKIIAGGR
ncbi:ribulose-phosphate 3-epimerase [Enterococcus casseliflavus]|uniref:ribulose-phosphate 3-epimerase n=1 Tax=Enterococcus casseliflavus TaxID=37734 RepID=UPI00237B6ABE|nr:hypothetical protein [Enterococcus casseliflavus]